MKVLRLALVATYLSTAFALAATSADAIAASSCKLALLADWQVKLVANKLIVDGAVNGKNVGVMLDTGGISMIFRAAADRLGLTHHLARGYHSYGVGGETYVEQTLVDEFKVGKLVRKNWDVMLAGERDWGKSIDVILGEDVFDKVDVEFDLPHHAVRLFQAEDCNGVALAYWAPQAASQVELEPGPRITVPVKINGRPVDAVLDSGAGVSILDKSAAARLGITPDSPGVEAVGKARGVGAKAVDEWIVPLQSFAIADETINDTVIFFADLFKDATSTSYFGSRIPEKIDIAPAMLLGADFLRAHRVLVAHSQRKMYFTYEGGPVFRPRTAKAARNPATEDAAPPAEPKDDKK